jgi:hypothetical protein
MSIIKYQKQQLAERLTVDGKNTYGKLVTGPTMSLDEVADEIAHITGMQQMACANVLRSLPTVIHHYVRGGLGVNVGFATLKPSIKTTATTQDGTIEVKKRRLTMRLSTEMKALLESIKVTVQTDGTVDDDEDTTDGEGSGNTPTDDSQQGGGTTPSGDQGGGDDTLQP